MLSDKKRGLDRSCHFDDKDNQTDDRVKSYEDISNQNIEASMKELRSIPYTIRYTSVVMPELLRIIRQYDFTEDW